MTYRSAPMCAGASLQRARARREAASAHFARSIKSIRSVTGYAPAIKWADDPSPQTHAIRSGGQHRRGPLGSPDEAAPHSPQLVQRCSVATALRVSTDHAADGLTAWPQISEL